MKDLLRFLNLLIIHHLLLYQNNQTELFANYVTIHFNCEKCCLGQGHVLGYHDKSDYERLYFSQKSIYKRKYHHQKKIKEVSNKFKLVLSEEGQNELCTKLMEINDYKLEKLNKKIRRKRLINIHYLIKNY